MSAPTLALQESAVLEYCRRLQLPTVKRQFSRLAQEAAKQNETHLTYLEMLRESELEERERNAITRRVQEARFPKVKTLEEFDFEKAPHIPAP
jgi:DNA replication protein DnaC